MNIDELLKRNDAFLSSLENNQEKKNKLKQLIKKQEPKTLVLTCSDSRVIPEEIFSSSFGDLFVIRSAGNVINDGELATLDYGINHLHIKLIIVLGHTHCGAIHASINDESSPLLAPILDKIKDHIKEEKDEKEASIINAIEVSKYIKEQFKDKTIEVIPLLYDITTHKIERI